jgi:DNA repair exonuclease SbcCD ATPase subunit
VFILDEPTIHLDSEILGDIVEVIANLRGVRQLILISHDPEFQNATNCTYRLSTSGDSTEVIREGGSTT